MTVQNENNDKTSNEAVNQGVPKLLKQSTVCGVVQVVVCLISKPREVNDVLEFSFDFIGATWMGLLGMMAASIGIILPWCHELRIQMRYLIWGLFACLLNAVATILTGQMVKHLIDYLGSHKT